MDYFLQKVGGKSARQAVTLRRCTPVEAPAVFALQNEVRAAMPHPEQFVPDTLENIPAICAPGYVSVRGSRGGWGRTSSCACADRAMKTMPPFWACRKVSGSTGPTQTAQ